MNEPRTTAAAGFGLVLAGVVVAVLGYLGVSSETEVPFQLPYFASAGIGALMLLGAGAAMLLSGRLARDTARLDDLEDALRQLCSEVGRLADDLAPQASRPADRAEAPDEYPETTRRGRAAPDRSTEKGLSALAGR